MIKYIGKCLLIEKEKEKIVVIGDIHLGAGSEIEGINIVGEIEREMIKELEMVFDRIISDGAGGKGEILDKIVLLGDLKNEFSHLMKEERYGLVNLFDYLDEKCEEIVVIRGNHDNYLLQILEKRGIKIYDYYFWNEYCFLHGDKDFKEIHGRKIIYWIISHLHPAISLREGVKIEKYKCFLKGKFKGKKIIILPSFADISEGIDVSLFEQNESNLAWRFDLKKFEVKIVGEKNEVLDFGVLGKIKKLKG